MNRATASPFNHAVLQPGDDRLLVRTIEVPETNGTATDAIYEFSSSLDLLRASFSDRYWDAHRALEAQGKISPTRAQCPDRDGPRQIEVWEPRTGWKTLTIAHWLAIAREGAARVSWRSDSSRRLLSVEVVSIRASSRSQSAISSSTLATMRCCSAPTPSA